MKSFFQKLFSKTGQNKAGNKNKRHNAGFVHQAHRDWAIMLVIFGVLAVACVFWGLVFFRQVNNGEAFLLGKQAAVPPTSTNLFNQADLDNVINQFNSKALEYSAELSGGGSVEDPSVTIVSGK
jgi:hypothetical protein